MKTSRDLAVTSSIPINADKTKVWAALTDPQTIREYLYGSETVTEEIVESA